MNLIQFRIGDTIHGVVLLSQFLFLYAMYSGRFFSQSFIDDGFCVANKGTFWYQSHALAFYSDTLFSGILYYMYQTIQVHDDPAMNTKLLQPVKENIVAVFFHGLGHLNLAFNSDALSHKPPMLAIENPIKKHVSGVVLFVFWYALIKAAYSHGGNHLRWATNSLIHTVVLGWAIPMNHSFTYVQTTLMLIASMSELNIPDKDTYYDIKAALVHLPLTIVGWIESIYCDSFVKRIGGHLIYDTTIPLSVISYHYVIYMLRKRHQS